MASTTPASSPTSPPSVVHWAIFSAAPISRLETADDTYEAVLDTVGAVSTRRQCGSRTCAAGAGNAVLVVVARAELLQFRAARSSPAERTIRGLLDVYTPAEFNESIVLAASLDTCWIATVLFDHSAQTFADLAGGKADPALVKVHFAIGN